VTAPTGKLLAYRPATASKATAGREWKRSRERVNALIKRIPGYSIVEDRYGVSYLYVLSWSPSRTKVDKNRYPCSGYLNWKALETAGLIAEEIENGRNYANARNR